MKTTFTMGVALFLGAGAIVGCSSDAGPIPAGQPATSGTGGSNATGSSGDTGSGTAGTTTTTGSSGETGGAAGDTGAGGSAGESTEGGAGGPSDEGGVAGGGTGTDGGAGKFPGWYEAEAIPPNEKAPMSTISHGAACTATPPQPGDMCESGGGEVNWITEGRHGWLQYNQVFAPSDGKYDVTWWYHCGKNDNFGDVHCGGQTDPPTTPSGCRPHQIVVNGVEMWGTYHFPCFPGAWIEIHAATTILPLKAGMNTVKVYPKQRDSADMDALQVQTMGQGLKPVITANAVSGSN